MTENFYAEFIRPSPKVEGGWVRIRQEMFRDEKMMRREK